MKIITLLTLSLTILSCESKNFKVGECVQKPDSITVWTISKIDADELTLEQDSNPAEENTIKSKASSSWIKTQCN